MIQIESNILIEKSPAYVWDYLCERLDFQLFNMRYKEVAITNGPPLRQGSIIRFRTEIGEQILEYYFKVKEFRPHSYLELHTESGLFPMRLQYSLSPNESNQCLLKLCTLAEPSGWLYWFNRLFLFRTRAVQLADLKALKSKLESW